MSTCNQSTSRTSSIDLSGLDPELSAKITIREFSRFNDAYPKKDIIYADSQEIYDIWEDMITNNIPSDVRYKKKPIGLLDHEKIVYRVKRDESLIMVDADTKAVFCVVLGSWLGADSLERPYINRAVNAYLNDTIRSARAEDPGRMGQVGLSTGQRDVGKGSAKHWAKNLNASAPIAELSNDLSCVFHFVYSKLKRSVPSEIIDELEKGVHRMAGRRMDIGPNGQSISRSATLSYVMAGKTYKAKYEDLSPPSGFVGWNYSRHTHSEQNGVEWCVAYTARRTKDESHGCCFYLADYRIAIPGRGDNLVCWKGKDLHGTTLAKCDPEETNPDFVQSGLAIIIPRELKATGGSDKLASEGSATGATQQGSADEEGPVRRLESSEVSVTKLKAMRKRERDPTHRNKRAKLSR